jgi:hypothetical protein
MRPCCVILNYFSIFSSIISHSSVCRRRHSDLVFCAIKHYSRVSLLARPTSIASAGRCIFILVCFVLIRLSRTCLWLVVCRQLGPIRRWFHFAASILARVPACANARLLLNAARRPGGACRRAVERRGCESHAPALGTRARCVCSPARTCSTPSRMCLTTFYLPACQCDCFLFPCPSSVVPSPRQRVVPRSLTRRLFHRNHRLRTRFFASSRHGPAARRGVGAAPVGRIGARRSNARRFVAQRDRSD